MFLNGFRVATDQLFDEGLSQKQQSEKNAEAKAKVQAIIAEERAKAEAEANVAEEAAAQAVRAEQAEREALAAKQAADDAAAQAEEAASIAAARAKEAAAVAATAEDIVEEKRREEEQAAMELEAMKEAIAAPRIGPNGEDRSDPHDRDANGAGRKDDLVPQSDRKHSVESMDGAGVGGGGAGAGAGAGKRRIAVDLGVAPEDSAVYLAEGRFTCADGSKAVDRSAVNDDFCDCPDGSDEPGTSACHGTSNFYCASEGRHLRALEVNDGVCDCCDGSDEWEKQVACADTCGALRKKAEAAKAAAARGSKIKQDYIMRGEEAQQKGKAGTAVPPAFWPLTERCYKKKQSEYLYELCFFKSVTQSKGRKERTDLGKKWRWTVDGKAGTFSHGKRCPGGPDRETRVEFECGEADAFVSIAESERCIYTAKFATPAACD